MKVVACAAFFILQSSLFTSCNSFLTDEPQSQITPEEAYNSVKNLKLNALLTVYNYIGGHEQSQGLQGTDRGVYDLNSFTTDEQIVPIRGGDWFDGGLWSRLFFHTWSAGEAPLKNTWDYLYKVVILCNEGIEHINAYKTTNVEEQEELESYKAERAAGHTDRRQVERDDPRRPQNALLLDLQRTQRGHALSQRREKQSAQY